MNFDQKAKIRTQRLTHRADIAHDMLFVLAMDQTAPWRQGTDPI